MNSNPPIIGHHLLNEGRITTIRDGGWDEPITGHRGGCQCGAVPPGFPNVRTWTMVQWHRDHKAQIRAAPSPSNIVPLRPDSVTALLHDYHTTLEDIATECDLEPAYRAAIQNLDDRYRTWCGNPEGEHCRDCGSTYGRTIWTAPDELWADLVNPTGAGLLCPGCFDDRAKAAGIELRWVPHVEPRYRTWRDTQPGGQAS